MKEVWKIVQALLILGNNFIKTSNFEKKNDLKIWGEQQTKTSFSLSFWCCLRRTSNLEIEISFEIGSFCGRNTQKEIKTSLHDF